MTSNDQPMHWARALTLVLWFLLWPFSAVFGTPSEAHENVTWRRSLVLLLTGLVLGAAVVGIHLLLRQ